MSDTDRQFLDRLTVADVPILRTEIPGPRSRELGLRESVHRSPGISAPAGVSGLAMKDGRGCLVRDVDDNVFIDFSGGAGAAITGHAHPVVTARIKAELDEFLHIYDYTSEARTRLYEQLAAQLPERLSQFQMYSGGTETVEAALRLARSYSGNDEFISLYRAFHGKTLGAMALMGGVMRRQFGAVVSGYYLTPGPYCYRCPLKLTYPSCEVACADVIESVVDEETGGRIAAVVVEPAQGAGGVIIPPPEFLVRIQTFCRTRGILFIVDEILTAPGRTGRLWACDHFGLRPDIMTLSKGIGSGYPVGVVASTEEVAKSRPEKQYGAGTTTFGGSPMAAVATLATLEVIAAEKLTENAERIGAYLKSALNALRLTHPSIGDVRGLGLLVGLEFVRDRETKEPISLAEADVLYLEIVRRGLLVASAGPIIRLTPPLVITQDLAERGVRILDQAIAAFEQKCSIG